ncbi:MAG TPA: hypothetical protein VEB66_02280 [Opitutaceae bacterium]|nr:hypothetical protein [Opitutaceae bacterium]
MKPVGHPLLEFVYGVAAFATALKVEAWAAVVVAAVTTFALLPLGIMRWRALLRDKPPPKKPEAEE